MSYSYYRAMAKTTTIEVKRTTWQRLNSRKGPGDSFDQVITRLLEDAGDQEIPEAESSSDQEDVDVDADQDELEDQDGEDIEAVALEVANDRGLDQSEADAFMACVTYLVREGRASRSELLEDVLTGREAGYASVHSLWKNAIQDAMSDLADRLESVVKPSGGRRWYEVRR